jgi:hypothetical protein
MRTRRCRLDRAPRLRYGRPAWGGVPQTVRIALTTRRQPFVAHSRLALAVVLSAVGFCYAAHSLWLGLSLAHPMPLNDQSSAG